MKNLLRLSVIAMAILLATAGLASAGAQERSATDGVTLMDVFSPSSCSQASGISMLAGPGDGCCSRHATICEGLCSCGILSFTCADNGTGGCSSGCKCNKCI
jgi:hypothetical protein